MGVDCGVDDFIQLLSFKFANIYIALGYSFPWNKHVINWISLDIFPVYLILWLCLFNIRQLDVQGSDEHRKMNEWTTVTIHQTSCWIRLIFLDVDYLWLQLLKLRRKICKSPKIFSIILLFFCFLWCFRISQINIRILGFFFLCHFSFSPLFQAVTNL